LAKDRVLARAIKGFDFKMLLDPLIEQLNLPTFPVEFRDSKGVEYGIIGYEPVNDTGGEVLIHDHSEGFGVFPGRFVTCQSDHLITYNTGLQISGTGAFNSIFHVVLGPCDEECSFCMDEVEQTVEVHVSFIHHVNGSGLDVQFVKQSDIMDGSLGQVYINREVASEVQQSMHLDTAFVLPERSPWAKLQAQTYRTAVKGIDQVVNVKPKAIVILIHRTGDLYKDTGKISIYPPVAKFISFCKGVTRDSMSYSAMVEFIGDRIQTVLNITEAISLSKLSKAHDIEVVTASEITNSMVPFVLGNTFIEFVFWHHRHKLCKNCFPVIHGDYLYDLAIKLNFKSLKNYILITN
jgi:hypothetical protein